MQSARVELSVPMQIHGVNLMMIQHADAFMTLWVSPVPCCMDPISVCAGSWCTNDDGNRFLCRYTVYDMGESITVGGGDQQSAADAHAAALELKKVGSFLWTEGLEQVKRLLQGPSEELSRLSKIIMWLGTVSEHEPVGHSPGRHPHLET
eukprot:1137680-Pelagomonas_calceolata.AAC.2